MARLMDNRVMNEAFKPIVEGLRSRAVRTYFQGEDQLVISRQRGSVSPFSGNSFWLSNQDEIWYLGTWAPNVYRVAPEADLLSLCEEFVNVGSSAQAEVPARIVEHFQLTRLSDEEYHSTFES
jgi:hypothetical protein